MPGPKLNAPQTRAHSRPRIHPPPKKKPPHFNHTIRIVSNFSPFLPMIPRILVPQVELVENLASKTLGTARHISALEVASLSTPHIGNILEIHNHK